MSKVQLYVYDLSRGLAKSMSLMLTGKQIDGIWYVSACPSVDWEKYVVADLSLGSGIPQSSPLAVKYIMGRVSSNLSPERLTMVNLYKY